MPQASARKASESSRVARLVTLHHRRRGWAWVATGSVIALLVYAGIDINLFEHLTGTTEILSAIPVLVLLVLAIAGIIVVIVDTAGIRRADAGVRVTAKANVSHHPIYAHAHSYPPRHHGSWVFAIFALVAMTGITLATLPAQVNSWGYVLGVETHDTFIPVSAKTCNYLPRGGCRVLTDGYLSNSGAHVTWNTQVPIGQPISVRDPLWTWGTGQYLTSGSSSAIATMIAGLFFDGATVLLVYALAVMEWHRRRNADRGHYGSGARSPARRGRARR